MIGKRLLFALGALLAFPCLCQANVITFEDLSIDQLGSTGAHVEDGFSYFAAGPGWEIQNSFGNPASALTTFFNADGSVVGNTVTITRVGGGNFRFESIDFATFLDSQADDVQITGALGDLVIGSVSITAETASVLDIQTVASTFSGLIDNLVIEVTEKGISSAMLLDNIVLTPEGNQPVVPEPATLSLVGIGLACAAARRRRARGPVAR